MGIKCRCGGDTQQVFLTPPNVITYTPYYSENLGETITGPRQRQTLMNAVGVEELNKYDSLVDVNDKAHRAKDKEYEDSKMPPEFVASYNKAMAENPDTPDNKPWGFDDGGQSL